MAYAALLLALGLPSALSAQDTAPTPQTIEDALRQMSDAAGVIFTGEVTAIRQRAGENGASGVVEIDFRVDEAIRSCSAGGTYTLREWVGLWAANDTRYRVGQRLLMLLHAPGAGGMSSPVGGTDGAIPLRATASAPQATSASTGSTPLIADLRWVGTRLERRVAYQSLPVVTGTSQQPSAADVSTAAQQAPVSVVVQMLRSWQQARP
ncbi:MAG: hypothetical protein JSS95_15135 [Acidobacteria bacterium]|nr:hypothetical protein [Acidobacteriota bacterium]